MEVHERLKYLREKKKYSINKLANLAGISQSYLRDVELGNKNISVEMLSYVCGALGISLKEFFDDGFSTQLENNSLSSKIYKLTPKQQKALERFIDTLI